MYPTHTSPVRRNLLPFSLIFLQLLVVTTLSFYIAVEWGGNSAGEQQLGQNISIAGIAVGGDTYEQAKTKLLAASQASQQAEVRFLLDGRAFGLDKSKLGIKYDIEGTLREAVEKSGRAAWFLSAIWGESAQKLNIPVKITYDRSELSRQLAEIGTKIARPAVSATGTVSNDKITIVPEVVGYRINLDKSLAVFDRFITGELAAKSKELSLEVQQEMPERLVQDIEAIDTLLAKQTVASVAAEKSSMDNLQRLVSRLNGTIVFPNEMFSFLERTGPYTAENGYTPIPILTDEDVPDRLGGGAAQVATALYQALLQSQLPVIERHAAPRPVSFAQAGLEALVSGDGLDLRFSNPLKEPLFIHAEVQANQISVALFGAKQEIPQTTISTEKKNVIAPDTIVRVNRQLAPNQEMIERKGSEGFTVISYQNWTEQNGNIVRKKISEDYYKPLHNIILVGPVYEKDQDKAEPEQGEEAQAETDEAPPGQEPAQPDSSSVPPPDIPTTLEESGSSANGGAGEPTVVDGIIYQN